MPKEIIGPPLLKGAAVKAEWGESPRAQGTVKPPNVRISQTRAGNLCTCTRLDPIVQAALRIPPGQPQRLCRLHSLFFSWANKKVFRKVSHLAKDKFGRFT